MDPAHNFVRLEGVIDHIETRVDEGRETDYLLLRCEGVCIWSRANILNRKVFERLRRDWAVDAEVIVIGSLESDGESIFINAFGVFTPEAYQLDQQRRKLRRRNHNGQFRTKS